MVISSRFSTVAGPLCKAPSFTEFLSLMACLSGEFNIDGQEKPDSQATRPISKDFKFGLDRVQMEACEGFCLISDGQSKLSEAWVSIKKIRHAGDMSPVQSFIKHDCDGKSQRGCGFPQIQRLLFRIGICFNTFMRRVISYV